MIKKKLYIFGIGGHSKVILSEVVNSEFFSSIIFIAPNDYKEDNILIDDIEYKVLNNLEDLRKAYDKNSCGVIGIGSIDKRIKIAAEVEQKIPNFKWTKIISANSTIAKNVKINDGTVVITGTIINTGTIIGRHCIINTRASIDHDNMIGDFINISPSVVTGGSVVINDNSDIGIGSTIKNNILIDKNVKIGGKSFVNKDCKSNSLYYGSPIKKIK
jgi:sugar O-acyltransferase (sialic acid O-acetyltransferase NeuD family)